MRTSATQASYGAVLALVLGGGAGLGAVAGPIDVGGSDDHATHPTTDDARADAPAAVDATATASAELGVDLTVPGTVGHTATPQPSHETTVDGYDVALDGQAAVGETELGFTIRRDGETVRTDPYLGAAGHLVAIRAGDLAYLHVHPLGGDGPEVRFAAEFPSAGTYRLFLDFSHGGGVRTAAFTVTVPDAGTGPGPAAPASDDEEGHDDGH